MHATVAAVDRPRVREGLLQAPASLGVHLEPGRARVARGVVRPLVVPVRRRVEPLRARVLQQGRKQASKQPSK